MAFDTEALARAALAFTQTLHETGGYSKEEIKNAFHPTMINAYFKLIEKQRVGAKDRS